MSDGFIPALQSLGYTQREAAFLYLVTVHSGYFVRRQFDYFIDRNKGAIVSNFLAKAQVAGHIEVIEYARGWRVYHLRSRTVYRLANLPESGNRQRKGDAAIRSSLITLDYVLENYETEHFLVGMEEKINFLRLHRGCPMSFYQDANRELSSVLKSSVISLEDRYCPATSLVHILFVDEGLLSMSKFQRVLVEMEPVLCHLGNFELIYGSNSERNFEQAGREFDRRFARHRQQPGPTYGQDLFRHRPAPVPNRVPFTGQCVTIFFKYAYPPLRRKYAQSSTVGSITETTTCFE
jgi:hypothetical protein